MNVDEFLTKSTFSPTSATVWRTLVLLLQKNHRNMDNDRGQSLITKYVWVIETIYRRRKISFKELNELWLRDDISRGVDIPKRTFDNWRYVIWDMFGINIANEGRGEYCLHPECWPHLYSVSKQSEINS